MAQIPPSDHTTSRSLLVYKISTTWRSTTFVPTIKVIQARFYQMIYLSYCVERRFSP
ncbi:hypothetical protein AZE42_09100 [Rhizopogon vesiculosus]|uniref:Uncharacterized protein n=1 Tax=Rhizopogon vesiculosus TaxID=180088 RepID=A0A1J8QTJ0_9AGAM|nr:hypothetical protein AZE42_09100 [Rhizopogon vesiculosus]